VAHVIAGALGVAAHAWGGLGELHAVVSHAHHAGQAVGGGHAGLGSGKVAHTTHAAAHRLAHRVVRASSLGHGEFGPVSRAADLEVLSALGLSGNVGAVHIGHAGGHVFGFHHHEVAHHALAAFVHLHHAGGGQTDEKSENQALHGEFLVGWGWRGAKIKALRREEMTG